jgi:hypothetical protein
MSDTERAAMRQRFQAMSPEERSAMRERRRQARESGGGGDGQ